MNSYHYILAPGWATTPNIWLGLIRELEIEGKVTSLNWVDYHKQDYNPLAGVVASEPLVFIGWSMGAMMALQYLATTHKPEVAALVCISGSARFLSEKGNPGANSRDLQAMTRLINRAPAQVLKNFFANVLSPEAGDEAETRLLRAARCFSSESLAAGLEYLRSYDSKESLNNIKTKTLILHGQEDAIIPYQAAELLQDLIPGASLKLYQDAGHALPVTRSRELSGDIRSFINELDNK